MSGLDQLYGPVHGPQFGSETTAEVVLGLVRLNQLNFYRLDQTTNVEHDFRCH